MVAHGAFARRDKLWAKPCHLPKVTFKMMFINDKFRLPLRLAFHKALHLFEQPGQGKDLAVIGDALP